jgi:hypothetical protein
MGQMKSWRGDAQYNLAPRLVQSILGKSDPKSGHGPAHLDQRRKYTDLTDRYGFSLINQ